MTKTTDQPTTPVDVLALLLLGAALGFTVALAVLGTVRIDDRHVFEMIVMCADQDLHLDYITPTTASCRFPSP